MKILFVTEKFPYPLDTGGNVRTFNLLKGLADEHEVTLLATTQGEVEDIHLQEIARLCRQVRLVRVKPHGLVRDLLTFALSLFGSAPFVISRHFRQTVQRELLAALDDCAENGAGTSTLRKPSAFDVVHFNHLDAAIYATHIPGSIVQVLDEHNVVSNQVRTALLTERRLSRRLILLHEIAKLQDYEARVCTRMDRCFVCSDIDAKALRQLGVQSEIGIIPNGVDLEYFAPIPLTRANDREVVFVGTLDYEPCEKGVWYFCTEILPLIRRVLPDIRFVAVGRNPSKRLQAMADSDKGVILTGRVENIRPYVQKARVFVVPLLSGSGTRLKILEAMAMGVPVVTTSIGVEGIDAVNGEDLWIADSPAAFADAVLRSLGDLPGAESMRDRARSLVTRKYSWQLITATLLEEYRRLAFR